MTSHFENKKRKLKKNSEAFFCISVFPGFFFTIRHDFINKGSFLPILAYRLLSAGTVKCFREGKFR